VVKKYTTDLKEYMKKHKVKEKVTNLQKNIQIPMSKENIAQFEALDKIRLRGIKQAEKKCRKLKMGRVPWSPKLSQARKEIVYWQMSIRQISNQKVNIKKIIRLAYHLKIVKDPNWTKEEMETKRKLAVETWRHLVKKAQLVRETWLEELAEQLELQGKGSK